MRTLLLTLGVACLLTGCGRKAPPVANNTPVPPRVEERQPLPPLLRDTGPRQEDAKPDAVADFGGPARKDVLPPVVIAPPQPEPMRPKPPVMEEEEEPRKPQPRRIEPKQNDPLRGIAPKPEVPAVELPKAEAPKIAPPERRIENVQPVPVQPTTKPVARRPVTEREMKDIHLFVDTASGASGVMPDPVTIQAALGAADSPAAKLVASGDIVLTGARQRESCWAYQKGAATDGGWIVTNSGAEQVDAATAKRWIGGR